MKRVREMLSKGSPQCLSTKYPSDYLFSTEIKIWLRRRIARNAFSMLKVEVIMATTSANGKGCGDACASSPSSPHPLLVIESHRRHIGHHDAEQGADVNTCLHCGGHTKQIYLIDSFHFRGQRNPLEQPLSIQRVITVCLAGELFAMKSEGWFGIPCQEFVIIAEGTGISLATHAFLG